MRSAPNFLESADNRLFMNEQPTFDRLFRAYHTALCYYAEQIIGPTTESDDVVSEVFLQCWTTGKCFDNEEHARYYFYRAVRNASLNKLKIGKRLVQKHERAAIGYDEVEQDHIYTLIKSEVMREIYVQIESLPQQERRVVLLGLQEGNKLQDIADIMGLSLQSVKNCRSRAIARLRLKLSPDDFLFLIVLLSMMSNKSYFF